MKEGQKMSRSGNNIKVERERRAGVAGEGVSEKAGRAGGG